MTEARFVGKGPIARDPATPTVDPLKDPAGYVAGDDLVRAVNVALALRMPLLVTGDPGTGKTQLAYRMAAELGLGPVLRFDTKSSSQATDLFYQFDSVRQFTQSQLNAAQQRELPEAKEFIRWQALGLAILRAIAPDAPELAGLGSADPMTTKASRSLVLIDEIDKAPRDFPNDLLNQIENREFHVPELGAHFVAPEENAPIVVITSNSEKQLPEAFLRRCVYHHIEFPKDVTALQAILGERLKRLRLDGRAMKEAVLMFFEIREDKGFSRSPSTSELLDWLRALAAEKLDVDRPLGEQAGALRAAAGALFKTREDIDRARALRSPAAQAGVPSSSVN
jgi:MoxR-like ATPase